jgi:hypothetical protein
MNLYYRNKFALNYVLQQPLLEFTHQFPRCAIQFYLSVNIVKPLTYCITACYIDLLLFCPE